MCFLFGVNIPALCDKSLSEEEQVLAPLDSGAPGVTLGLPLFQPNLLHRVELGITLGRKEKLF